VKHFINDRSSIVTEAIDAMVLLGEGKLTRLDGYPSIKVVARTDWVRWTPVFGPCWGQVKVEPACSFRFLIINNSVVVLSYSTTLLLSTAIDTLMRAR
jgi:hypothetical protein